jgi:hypothetical protein
MASRKRQHSISRTLRLPQNVISTNPLRHGAALGQRARGLQKNERSSFSPPEDWHEPVAEESGRGGYRIIVQPPGDGYRHVLTPREIRRRLARLPARMLERLEVVQLSRLTRKKLSFPCYGMQWGTAVYLYPIESGLVECYSSPPRPAQVNEARMYGGRWVQSGVEEWQLVWTEAAIKDYYLNNILIHELGHLVDHRNESCSDRERYAEWFAIEHGYRRSQRVDGGVRRRRHPKSVVRRHHGT